MVGIPKKTVGSTYVLSFLVLGLALVLFLYLAVYKSYEHNMERFRSLNNRGKKELQVSRKAKTESSRARLSDSVQEAASITTVPMFLENINKEFLASALQLDHIQKSESDDSVYSFTALAPFDCLVDFLLRIEQSNLALQDLAIHPYSSRKNLINITLRVIKDEMTPEDREEFIAYQERYQKTIRDPFRKGGTGGQPGLINLTWKYKLSGIGFDTERYATIDHKDYYKGDLFHGLHIVRIQSDQVHLEAGSQKYFLGFRYKRTPGGE
jgi:hypothetical protein